jgi:hypothetical protein
MIAIVALLYPDFPPMLKVCACAGELLSRGELLYKFFPLCPSAPSLKLVRNAGYIVHSAGSKPTCTPFQQMAAAKLARMTDTV